MLGDKTPIAESGCGAPVEPRELRAVLAAAQRAPSVMNTQPWRFVLSSSGIEVHADGSRLLKRADPDGRELAISCGAAIFNMRVAAAAMRRVAHVQVLPDAADRNHLATVTFGLQDDEPLPNACMYEAIRRRHTHRGAFTPGGVPADVMQLLAEQAKREHVQLMRVDERQHRAVAHITRLANRLVAADPQYRRELRRWTTTRSRSVEGVPVTGFGTRDVLGDPPLRDFGLLLPWLERAPEHFGLEEWVVIITDRDEPAAWLAAGQAMERVLLTATGAGLAASFMTQSIELPALRSELRRCLGVAGEIQLLLRVGPASALPAAGRRPLDQVVTVGTGVARLLLDRANGERVARRSTDHRRS